MSDPAIRILVLLAILAGWAWRKRADLSYLWHPKTDWDAVRKSLGYDDEAH